MLKYKQTMVWDIYVQVKTKYDNVPWESMGCVSACARQNTAPQCETRTCMRAYNTKQKRTGRDKTGYDETRDGGTRREV